MYGPQKNNKQLLVHN